MFSIKRLSSGGDDEVSLQRLLEAAPRYAKIAEGAAVSASAAVEVFEALPSGKGYEDKFVFGFYAGQALVACADLIRSYPNADTAFIGLLLVSEAHEGKGYGSKAFAGLCSVVQEWGTCSRFRLAVIDTNQKAHGFWAKHGFSPTGESKPRNVGGVQCEVLMYERALATAAQPIAQRGRPVCGPSAPLRRPVSLFR
jgi:RimJ/RimL family protein N-acetyltransferase